MLVLTGIIFLVAANMGLLCSTGERASSVVLGLNQDKGKSLPPITPLLSRALCACPHCGGLRLSHRARSDEGIKWQGLSYMPILSKVKRPKGCEGSREINLDIPGLGLARLSPTLSMHLLPSIHPSA